MEISVSFSTLTTRGSTLDVIIWRPPTSDSDVLGRFSHCKGKYFKIAIAHNICFKTKQKELTKTYVMISNWKRPWSPWFQRFEVNIATRLYSLDPHKMSAYFCKAASHSSRLSGSWMACRNHPEPTWHQIDCARIQKQSPPLFAEARFSFRAPLCRRYRLKRQMWPYSAPRMHQSGHPLNP